MTKFRWMRWAGHVARRGDMRNTHMSLVRRRELRGMLGRVKYRWEDNIKMDHK
jgi:hypothetical protein